ncbi:MAG: VCBS repeat-containing protein [Saprospiraceae bacterium]|nr:VCBS repeat-containing protein [Saprospiraceae bacterium]
MMKRALVFLAVLSTLSCGTTAQSQRDGNAPLAFRLHVICDTVKYSACAVMDVNKDGRMDVVSGAHWYEGPNWKQHFVRDVEIIKGRPDGYSHLELDVNQDGWIDLVHVNFRSRSIYWLEHPGAVLGEWTKHMVAEPGAMETGRLYDIDGDGTHDLLPNGWEFAAWYEVTNPPDQAAPHWSRHTIHPKGAGHGCGFGDVNGDGMGDYVGIHGWAEAPQDPRNGDWIWHPEFELGKASIPVIVDDLDGDGDTDLIWSMGHDYGTYWMEQYRDGQQRVWRKHLIDSTWSQGHSPLWVDLDQNGTKEFINGKRFWSHEGRDPGAHDPLVIYRYEYDADRQAFERYAIQENGPAGVGLDPKAADLDNDGDIDLVLPGRSGLYWYENLLK